MTMSTTTPTRVAPASNPVDHIEQLVLRDVPGVGPVLTTRADAQDLASWR